MGTKGRTSYRIEDQNALYFITATTVEWVDVFTRRVYKDIIIDSLDYCIKNKGLVLNGYVIMTNHIHLVCRATEGFALSDILRDFKRHTAKYVIEKVKENPQESRREWLIKILLKAGAKNSKNKKFQLWRQDNHPIELYSNSVIIQKLNYLHNNPVEEGIVQNPEDYLYSSARNYAGMDHYLEIELLH